MPIVPLYGHATLRERLLDHVHRATLPQSLLLHGPGRGEHGRGDLRQRRADGHDGEPDHEVADAELHGDVGRRRHQQLGADHEQHQAARDEAEVERDRGRPQRVGVERVVVLRLDVGRVAASGGDHRPRDVGDQQRGEQRPLPPHELAFQHDAEIERSRLLHVGMGSERRVGRGLGRAHRGKERLYFGRANLALPAIVGRESEGVEDGAARRRRRESMARAATRTPTTSLPRAR